MLIEQIRTPLQSAAKERARFYSWLAQELVKDNEWESARYYVDLANELWRFAHAH